MLNLDASHMGKKEALNIPLIGRMIKPLDAIMVGRDKKDSKEVRNNIIKDLEERQIQAEQGKRGIVCIFPEGATTNGKYLMKFKRGAFASLRAVQPAYSKIWTSSGQSVAQTEAMPFVKFFHSFVMMHGYSTLIMSEMPVFAPNEYFWKNHWDGKEEKWDAFARAVR